jgi:cell division protein FtsW (lipid II flippase)
MEPASSRESATSKRAITVYNQLINFGWTILAFAPVGYFCYVAMPLHWLYAFLAVSSLSFLLPASFFRAIQLGNTTSIYHKLGLRTVRKYTQDGILVNRLIREKEAAYNPVRTSSVQSHLSRAAANERFHGAVFVFFLLTTIYALAGGHWGWAAVLTISNLVYNVYPILLQQYNRIRFRQLADRRQGPQKSSD